MARQFDHYHGAVTMRLDAVLNLLCHTNKKLPPELKYGAAADVTTQDQARAHLKACATHTLETVKRRGLTLDEAIERELVKIGYWAGSCPERVRRRIETLYGCVHPYAGASTTKSPGRVIQLPVPFSDMCDAWDSAERGGPVFGKHVQPSGRVRYWKDSPNVVKP